GSLGPVRVAGRRGRVADLPVVGAPLADVAAEVVGAEDTVVGLEVPSGRGVRRSVRVAGDDRRLGILRAERLVAEVRARQASLPGALIAPRVNEMPARARRVLPLGFR